MKNKRLWVGSAIGIVLLLLIILGIIFFFSKDENTFATDKVVIKENVYVISSEDEENVIPIGVEDGRIIFAEKPEYAEGDVIVSGITEQAPNGFIRRVVSVAEEKGKYVVITESAYLTDVFEEAHIKRTITLLDDGAEVVWNGDINARMLQSDIARDLLGQIVDNETDYQFAVAVEEKFDNEVEVNGVVGYNFVIELEMDIEDGEIEISMVAKHENAGILNVEYGKDLEWSFKKELFSKKLPNVQFMVGTIPIVVTNELSSELEGEASLGGAMETSFELKMENVAGFKYDSRTNEVTEIKELNYLSDGIQWETGAKATIDSSVGVSLSLVSKLYDSTGFDLGVGIAGSEKGEVAIDPVELSYAGSIDLVIEPKLQGSIVVSVPIIDEKLADKPMFEMKLPALWEKHWESSKNWKEDLLALKSVELNNTFTTKLPDVHMIDSPQFIIEYPDNWKVIYEEVIPMEEMTGREQVLEEVILKKVGEGGGAQVEFRQFNGDSLGGYGRTMMAVEVSKVADSNFIPINYSSNPDSPVYSDYGKHIIAKIKVVGMLNMDKDSKYESVDGECYYAIVPETLVGSHDGIIGLSGLYELCLLDYRGEFVCIAKTPDGAFTAEQEKETIAILSSFREELSDYPEE